MILDEVIERLPQAKTEEQKSEEPEPRIAIVGRPNVGKSSLVNRVLREDRMVVSAVAVLPGMPWIRTPLASAAIPHRDTAGIRKQGRVARSGAVESVSVLLAKRECRRRPDCAGDRMRPWAQQTRTVRLRRKRNRGGAQLIIAVNKGTDEGQRSDFAKALDDKLRFNLKFLDFAHRAHLRAHGERRRSCSRSSTR